MEAGERRKGARGGGGGCETSELASIGCWAKCLGPISEYSVSFLFVFS